MRSALVLAVCAASCASAGPLEISVSREGKPHVLGDETQPGSLEQRLKTYAAAEKAGERVPEVRIDCAGDAPVGALFNVIFAGAGAAIADYRIKVDDVEASLRLPTDKGMKDDPPGGVVPLLWLLPIQVCSSLNREEHAKEWDAHAKGLPTDKAADGAYAWIGEAVDTAKDLAEEGAAKEVAQSVAAELKRKQAKAAQGDSIVPVFYVDPDVRVGLWHRLFVELQAAGIQNPEFAALRE